jgi:hypothetical protein
MKMPERKTVARSFLSDPSDEVLLLGITKTAAQWI